MRERVSACVITRNEEKKIRRCLESLSWCDELIVVDSFSTDATVEICREFTDKVYQHEWLGYIGQRSLIRDMATCPWILFVDADEEISTGLRDEIISHLSERTGEILGFRFPRKVFYLGRWIEYGEWYPDIKLRLFRKNQSSITGVEPHDQVQVDGPVKTLQQPLYHYTYDDIDDHLLTMNRFTSISALAKYQNGGRFSWADFLIRPGWRFLKAYIFKRGFLDGRRGLLIAMISALGVAVKYAKMWELDLARQGVVDSPPSPEDDL